MHAPLVFLNPAHRSAPLIWLFDPLLFRSTPQRGRILGGIRVPDLPTNRGPPTTPADFFLHLSHAWFLIPYRPTINNMIILSKAFSYKIRKCILFAYLPDTELNLALLHSGILHIKTVYTHWNEIGTKHAASNSCETVSFQCADSLSR